MVGTADISKPDMDINNNNNNNSKDTLGIHHGSGEELTAVVVATEVGVGMDIKLEG